MTTPLPGALPPPWAGTMPLSDLNQAVVVDPSLALSDQQADDPQRFWATDARPATSPVSEALQLTLGATRIINRVGFEVSHFPCDIRVEYYDATARAWTPCLDSTVPGAQPVAAGVRDSVPAVLPPISSVSGHLHPQHSFSGHWQRIELEIQPVTTNNIRLVLTRTATGAAPTDNFAVLVDYSLAVRNLVLGYTVAAKSDIPSTTGDVFASTTDLFGSPVSYSVRTNAAQNVLRSTSTPQGTQLGQQLSWRCSPQPVPWAVVNFHLDVRSASGGPQVIDQIWLDPLYTGPSMNLYYSNDDPTSRFDPGFTTLPYGVAVAHDQLGLGGNVLSSGLAGVGGVAYVDVDNTEIGFDPTHSWWLGGKLNAKYHHNGTESANHPILDTGYCTVCLTAQGFQFATSGGDTLVVPLDPFDPATTVTFLLSYDGRSTVTASLQVGSKDYAGSLTLTTPPTQVSTLRFGGFQGVTPGTPDIDFGELVLKIDDVPDASTVISFLNAPDPYILNAPFLGAQDPRVHNALLRYSTTFVDSKSNPTGFLGGAPDRYADMSWTPITRDFTLVKGFCTFNPTRAKYLKMEFSGLVPEAYDVYEPVNQTVKTYPTSMWQAAGGAGSPVDRQQPGTTASWVVNVMLAAQRFTGGANPIVGTGGLPGKDYTSTTARVLTNLAQQQSLARQSHHWRYLPSSSPTVMPCFAQAGPHTYEQIDIAHTSKVAYFVGLKSVIAYRLDYTATDDTPQYVESFHDTTYLGSNTNFTLSQAHVLTSGAAQYAEATSVVFPSNRVVSAIQFSATQSQPQQLLPDADFDDPAHAAWTQVGDGVFFPGVHENQVLGSTLQIGRNAAFTTYDMITAQLPTWQASLNINASFDALRRGFVLPGNSGGVSSRAVTSPPGGRVYAAARVTAPKALTSPLYVQIINDATGAVLAEEAATVPANSVTEFYTGYHIGDGVDARPFRWSDFGPAPTATSMVDSFHRANATTLGSMDTGNIWSSSTDANGNPLSLALSGNTAVVTAQGQSDFVDTGSIWGSLEFHVGTMGATGTPGPNILHNGAFATGISGWSGAGGTLTWYNASGVTAGKLTPTGSAANTQIVSEFEAVIPGALYSVTAQVLPTNAVTSNFSMVFSWCDANGNQISTTSTALASLSAGSWSQVTATAVAPAGAVYLQFAAQIGGTPPASQIWYLDQVTITTAVEAYLAQFGPLAIDQAGQLLLTSGAPMASPNNNVLTTNQAVRAVQAGDDIRIDVMPTFAVPSGKADTTQTVDPIATPYSAVIYLNGTWVRTVSHDRGTRQRVGIKGNQGQVFSSFSYTPLTYGGLPSAVISGLPTGSNGSWYSTSTTAGSNPSWVDADNRTWQTSGTWNTTTPPVFPGRDDCGTPLVATSSGSAFYTDVGWWYGSMTTRVTSLAGGASGVHGNVLCLDHDNGIYVDVNGNILVGATNYGNLFPGGISAGQNVTVQWLRTSQVSAATLGSINATQYPDMLVGKVNGAIVGRFAHANLAVWRGTKRGVAGDSYAGTPPSWMGTVQANTAFQSFVWAPDASYVAQNPTTPTWITATQNGSETYASVPGSSVLSYPQLRAQVVQYGQSTDVFDVDTLSLFVDPIIWEFSNDGGHTFYPAYDIRNNPRGVLAFPTSVSVSQFGAKPGTGLAWRVRSYAPNSVISSLAIRPWYAGMLSGLTHRVGLATQGPNVMPYDHLGDITQDARFQLWSKPVPQSWFFAYRSLAATTPGYSATAERPLVLPESINTTLGG